MPRLAKQEAPHRLSYFRSEALAGVEFARCEFRGPLAPTVLDHRWIFTVCDLGSAQASWRGGTHAITAGALYSRRPGELAAVRRRESSVTRHRQIFIEPELILRLLAERGPGADVDPPPMLPPGHAAVVAFDALYEAATNGALAPAQESLFAEFISVLASSASPPPPETPQVPARMAAARGQRARAVELAKRHLEEHFSEEVPLEQLATVAGVSKYHLIRLFRAELELPPHAYLLALRIDHARRLIVSRLPLVEVASRTGFADQSHFTRHFKRLVGVAPGAYARSG